MTIYIDFKFFICKRFRESYYLLYFYKMYLIYLRKIFKLIKIEDIIDVYQLDRNKQSIIAINDFVTKKDQKKLVDLVEKGYCNDLYNQDWYRVSKSIELSIFFL